MNSNELKKSFPGEYKKYFSSCVKVVSAPHVFFWTGDFSNFYDGLAICSKIPLRFYAGLEKISEDEFEISSELRAYFPSRGGFYSIKLDEYIVNSLKAFLSKDLRGFRINFFSELPLGASLGGLGAMSACISKLKNCNSGEVEKEAIELTKSLQRGRKSTATALSCMSESSYPILYMHEKGKPVAKGLDEIIKLPKDIIWPIDFGLVFSGKLVRGNAVISSAKEMQEVSRDLQQEATKILGSYSGSLWEDYLKILNHVACQCLVGMKKIFHQARDSDVAFLFSTLNQYQNLLYFLGVSTPKVNEIYSAIHREANYLENKVGSGCKITGVGRGGDVLFAIPYGEMRENIENTIKNISQKSEGEISLDYSSWRDGTESKGLIIEQDIHKKLFSPFIAKGMYLVEVYEGTGVVSKILSMHEIERINLDLLLNYENKKVAYKGKKVDSTKILSQKATVEILYKLLKSKNKKITNDKIPSAYGTSRFDLQSKVVSPLEKLTNLSFKIEGKMYNNFTLKLKTFDISIGIVSKLS